MDVLPTFSALVTGLIPAHASAHDLRWLHKEHIFLAHVTHGAVRAWHLTRAAECRNRLMSLRYPELSTMLWWLKIVRHESAYGRSGMYLMAEYGGRLRERGIDWHTAFFADVLAALTSGAETRRAA